MAGRRRNTVDDVGAMPCDVGESGVLVEAEVVGVADGWPEVAPSVTSVRNTEEIRSGVTLAPPDGRARWAGMDFEFDAGQRAWLTEVREFLHDNVTPELRA